MNKPQNRQRNPLGDYVIHVGAGFVAKERPHVLEALSTLGVHLGRWNPQDVSLEVSLQDRGRKEQRVTLRTTLPGLRPWWRSPTAPTSRARFTTPRAS